MARNTQRLIADALRRLMQDKELDKITVQEIADEANVNKKTFYYHFHGITDLVCWMYTYELDQAIHTAVIQPDNWVDMVQRFANRIRKDREHITKIYYSSSGGALRQAVIRTFDRATEKYLRAIIAQYEKDYGTTLALSPIQIEYIVGYHAMALYGTLEKWFLRGMQDPVEEFLGLVQMMNTLNNYRLFKTLETLSPEVPAKE